MTTTLLSMFIYMDGWNEKVVKFFGEPYLLVVVVGTISAPLILPFTKKDLRQQCLMMILIDSAIILYINSKNIGSNPNRSIIDLIIALYSFSWFIYLGLISKLKSIDYIMDKNQANALICCLAASASVIIVFVEINFFSVYWTQAYMIVSIFISIACSLIPKSIYSKS